MPLKKVSRVETFNWHVKPAGGIIIEGDVYPDGSARDGPIPELVRCGWSFVVVDKHGNIDAAAYGVPPPWVTDIGGAEAWALYQSTLYTLPGSCRYWPDCLPVKLAMSQGPSVARDPRNPLARVHGLLHNAFEGVDPETVGWMPAHLKEADLALGTATKSDGSKVTGVDLQANDAADGLAKLGVEFHRIPPEELKRWKKAYAEVKSRAKWIGTATHLSNNMPNYPFRDSEAARWKAVAAQRSRDGRRRGVDGRRRRRAKMEKAVISSSNGGHELVKAESGGGWVCVKCRGRTSSWMKMATTSCNPDGAKAWARKAPLEDGRRHNILTSGSVLWCGTCGCFAESRARRLLQRCTGPPPVSQGSGGLRQQLLKLRAGIHPVSGSRLPPAYDENGNVASGCGKYLRLNGQEGERTNFVPYEPEVFTLKSKAGSSSDEKRRRVLGRIRCSIASEKRKVRKAKQDAARLEANDLIQSFIIGSDVRLVGDDLEDDNHSNKAFWNSLVADGSRSQHLDAIASESSRRYTGVALMSRSRCKQPVVRRRAELGRRCTVLTCFEFGCNGGHS